MVRRLTCFERHKLSIAPVKHQRQTSSIITAIATVVIACGTILYWRTTDAMLLQMKLQAQQTQQAIDEARKTNETMQVAYNAAIQSNRIIQSQLELQVAQNFYDKRQQHYDLKAQRDGIIHRDTPDFKVVQSKLDASK
ncbi:hypothetical protein MJD09_04645 [bacterium]|nr:hypothetical protein [bacterium]